MLLGSEEDCLLAISIIEEDLARAYNPNRNNEKMFSSADLFYILENSYTIAHGIYFNTTNLGRNIDLIKVKEARDRYFRLSRFRNLIYTKYDHT